MNLGAASAAFRPLLEALNMYMSFLSSTVYVLQATTLCHKRWMILGAEGLNIRVVIIAILS